MITKGELIAELTARGTELARAEADARTKGKGFRFVLIMVRDEGGASMTASMSLGSQELADLLYNSALRVVSRPATDHIALEEPS